MSRYQITITMPNGTWRIRRQTAAEVNEIARHLLQTVSDKIKIPDLQKLWPSEAIAKWHKFGDDCFDAVCEAVAHGWQHGQFDVLKTGQQVLPYSEGALLAKGWKEIEWSAIAKRLLKILLSAVIGWLRVQFPAINAGNAGQAVKILAGLAARRG